MAPCYHVIVVLMSAPRLVTRVHIRSFVRHYLRFSRSRCCDATSPHFAAAFYRPCLNVDGSPRPRVRHLPRVSLEFVAASRQDPRVALGVFGATAGSLKHATLPWNFHPHKQSSFPPSLTHSARSLRGLNAVVI